VGAVWGASQNAAVVYLQDRWLPVLYIAGWAVAGPWSPSSSPSAALCAWTAQRAACPLGSISDPKQRRTATAP